VQFYFIRHAQSENNLLLTRTGSFTGRSEDPDLTPVGRQQAEVLAQFLQQHGQTAPASVTAHDPQNVGGFSFTHLYCRLMLRSVATGTVLSRTLGLPLVAWEDLHETGGIHQKDEQTGERVGLPGRNRAYFEIHHPNLVLPESLGEEGWWNRPFEEVEHRSLRARRVVNDFLERHGDSDARVAVVSHGGFYNHLLRAILNIPEEASLWFTLNNTAITRIDYDGQELWLSYMNRLDFMPRELIT
jgi:2,3-bisphosphoglycerate-dependent phosphoglycerate mutase